MRPTHPYVLVEVAGGGEQSVADVTLVRSQPLRLRPGPAAIHQDPVYRLQVDVEVPGLGVTPTAQPTPVRPLISVDP